MGDTRGRPVDEVAEAGDKVAAVTRTTNRNGMLAWHSLQRISHGQQRP